MTGSLNSTTERERCAGEARGLQGALARAWHGVQDHIDVTPGYLKRRFDFLYRSGR